MTPVRIQRHRARGWTMPPNTVYVGRPTKWGNPFVVGIDGTREECVKLYQALARGYLCISKPADHVRRQEMAHAAMTSAKRELRGKNLACWCPVGSYWSCHANVLLEIANGKRGRR